MITLKSFTSIKLLAVCLVTISVLGTSCTSLQQATTIASDDLYSTPALQKSIVASGIIKSNKSDEAIAQEILNGEEDEYQEYQNYQDDRYLRLKVANRNRWAMIDDYGYWNDPRYNNAYYPSYLGWNSWYNGYYGSSWYNPFGYSMSIGWGGYGPFMNSYYSLGWGFNDFGFGGFNDFGFGGYGGFGYGGFGGFGGFGGYGGWNPYYASYWNPYGSYYGGGYGGGYGGIYGGGMGHIGRPYNPQTRAMQTSGAGLAAYSNNRVYNNNTNNRLNTTTGNTRYTGNPELNNRFGNLVRRVVTNNTNPSQANSFDRPSRTFNNGGFTSSNQNKVSSNNTPSSNSSSNSRPTLNSNAGGNSGGFNSSGSSTGGGRAPRNRN
jgi:hypothetical protein